MPTGEQDETTREEKTATDAQPVQTFREVPREPQHCGKPMGKVLIGATLGRPRYRYVCMSCEAQQDGPEIK